MPTRLLLGGLGLSQVAPPYQIVGMVSLLSVLLVAQLIYLFKLGNYIVFFLRALLPILAKYKMSEAAATVPAISEADILHVIYS